MLIQAVSPQKSKERQQQQAWRNEEQRQARMQALVYAASQSQSDLRCGDHVTVEWEGEWFPGTIADITGDGMFAVAYEGGDFEAEVPGSAIKRADDKARTAAKSKLGGKRKKGGTQLHEAADAGDPMLLLQLLHEGSDVEAFDDNGFTPLHWVAGPKQPSQGDTVARRRCVYNIARRVASVDKPDNTDLGLRPVQYAVALNLVGVVKVLATMAKASLAGTVHWAINCKSHGTLRELLALGAHGGCVAGEWGGCSPLMLASELADVHAVRVLLHHGSQGEGSLLKRMLGEVQRGGNGGTALHCATEHTADEVVRLLLFHGANPFCESARGETPLEVAARRREEHRVPEKKEEARRCAELLEAAEAEFRAAAAEAGDSEGETEAAEMEAEETEETEAAALALANEGALANALDKEPKGPLHHRCRGGDDAPAAAWSFEGGSGADGSGAGGPLSPFPPRVPKPEGDGGEAGGGPSGERTKQEGEAGSSAGPGGAGGWSERPGVGALDPEQAASSPVAAAWEGLGGEEVAREPDDAMGVDDSAGAATGAEVRRHHHRTSPDRCFRPSAHPFVDRRPRPCAGGRRRAERLAGPRSLAGGAA